MVANLAKGLASNPDAHSFDQLVQRDPGEVYNTSIDPGYSDILPDLNNIVNVLS